MLTSSRKQYVSLILFKAHAELIAEGWIISEPARGTFVSDQLPERVRPQTRAPRSTRTGFPLRRRMTPVDEIRGRGCCDIPKGALYLSGGVPDGRLIPVAELARAYRRALKRHGHELMRYGQPQGLEPAGPDCVVRSGHSPARWMLSQLGASIWA